MPQSPAVPNLHVLGNYEGKQRECNHFEKSWKSSFVNHRLIAGVCRKHPNVSEKPSCVQQKTQPKKDVSVYLKLDFELWLGL